MSEIHMRQSLQQAVILLGRLEARRDASTRAEVRHFIQSYSANPPFNSDDKTFVPFEIYGKVTEELARYKLALQRANGYLIQLDRQPVKLEYSTSDAEVKQ